MKLPRETPQHHTAATRPANPPPPSVFRVAWKLSDKPVRWKSKTSDYFPQPAQVKIGPGGRVVLLCSGHSTASANATASDISLLSESRVYGAFSTDPRFYSMLAMEKGLVVIAKCLDVPAGQLLHQQARGRSPQGHACLRHCPKAHCLLACVFGHESRGTSQLSS